MKLTITTRHFKANDELEDMVRDALEHVRSFHNGIIGADVVLERDHAQCRAEFVLKVNSKSLVAKESADDFARAIHGAREALVRQIRKMKTRDQRRW